MSRDAVLHAAAARRPVGSSRGVKPRGAQPAIRRLSAADSRAVTLAAKRRGTMCVGSENERTDQRERRPRSANGRRRW